LALRYLRTLQTEAAKHRGISRRQREKIAPGLESDELRAAASVMTAQPVGLPALVRVALGIRAHWAATGDRGTAHMAAPAWLTKVGAIGFPLPFVTGSAMRLPYGRSPRETDPTLFVVRYLEAVATAAEEAQRSLFSLALTWARWRAFADRRRGDSGYRQVVDLMSALPFLTPARVGAALRFGRKRRSGKNPAGSNTRAAGRILAELAASGILVEATGRQTVKVYVPATEATVKSVVQRTGTQPRRRGGMPSNASVADGPVVTTITDAVAVCDEREHRALEVGAGERLGPANLPEIDFAALFADTDRAIARVKRAIEAAQAPSSPTTDESVEAA
jgi:hypothetical protein